MKENKNSKKDNQKVEKGKENVKNKETEQTIDEVNLIRKKVWKNIMAAVLIITYFAILGLAYVKLMEHRLVGDLKIFSGVYLVVGIVCLEQAYRKKSGEQAITAIELLGLSAHSLSIMHIISLYKINIQMYLIISGIIILVYYVLKAIIVYTKMKKSYMLKVSSDVSEIVKKEPQKKQATKRKK